MTELKGPQSPWQSILGARFHHLMPQLRQLHGGRAPAWRGQVSVVPGGSALARLVARVAGFPPAMHKAPMTLQISLGDDGAERWERDFDGHRLSSTVVQMAGSTFLSEKFGPITVVLRPEVKVDALHVSVDSARIIGRALPKALTPQSSSVIWQDEAGRYRFDIAVDIPMLGRVISYEGWLRPDQQSQFVR